MKTGDIYFDEYDRVCIHLDGKEQAFNNEGSFDTTNHHANLERIRTGKCNLMYNSSIEEARVTGINIMDTLNDPEILEALRKQCQTT